VCASEDIECEPNEFRCADKRKCIPNSMKCDSRPNCNDSSDELPSACGTPLYFLLLTYLTYVVTNLSYDTVDFSLTQEDGVLVATSAGYCSSAQFVICVSKTGHMCVLLH